MKLTTCHKYVKQKVIPFGDVGKSSIFDDQKEVVTYDGKFYSFLVWGNFSDF